MFIPGRGAFPKPDEEELTTGKSDTIFSSADFNVPLLILNMQYCTTVPNFDVESYVVQFKNTCYKGEEVLGDDSFRWGQLTVRVQLKRKAEEYMHRVGLYKFLLTYTSLCALTLNPVDGLGDCLSFLIKLILAALAFQFIVSQYLPNVSFLTLLDQYTFLVFTLCCVLLGVLSWVGSADMTKDRT